MREVLPFFFGQTVSSPLQIFDSCFFSRSYLGKGPHGGHLVRGMLPQDVADLKPNELFESSRR